MRASCCMVRNYQISAKISFPQIQDTFIKIYIYNYVVPCFAHTKSYNKQNLEFVVFCKMLNCFLAENGLVIKILPQIHKSQCSSSAFQRYKLHKLVPLTKRSNSLSMGVGGLRNK